MSSLPPAGSATRLYKPSDWAIFTYAPEPGCFILGTSILNIDILGSVGGSITKSSYVPTSILINEGYENNGEATWDFQPTTTTVQFSIKNFDTPIMNKFVIGTDFIVALKSEQTSGTIDPILGAYIPYFTGFISEADVTVNPFDVASELTISGISNMQKHVSRPLVIRGTNSISMPDLLINSGVKAYFGDLISYPSNTYFINNFIVTHAISEYLTNYLAGFGYFWDDKTRVVLDSYQGKVNFGKTITDTDIITMELGWHNRTNPIGTLWTNEQTGVTISAGGISENDSNGGNISSFTYNIDGVTNPTFPSYRQIFAPVSVTMVTKQTFEQIVMDTGSSSWIEPFPNISNTLTINTAKFTASGDYEVIGKVHEINQDVWTTKLNLRTKGN